MADIQLATQSKPATPSAGNLIIYPDSTNKEVIGLDDAGNARVLRPLTNANTGQVTANAADTYLTGSSITVPPALLRVGARIVWSLCMTKSAAGTATPIVNIRVGTAGTTADTARHTFTFVAQTAATDTGYMEISWVVRTAGASGVTHAYTLFSHAGTTTGLANQAQEQILQNTSAAHDLTVAGTIVGLSCNPGASGVWTFEHVTAKGFNL